MLWLQEQCARKILPVHKVPGESNPADLRTKHLGTVNVLRHVEKLELRFLDGRAGTAAQLHQLNTTLGWERRRPTTALGGHGRSLHRSEGRRRLEEQGRNWIMAAHTLEAQEVSLHPVQGGVGTG